jgi:FKBP-type peptidyl-prolyl cis-trans isomerase
MDLQQERLVEGAGRAAGPGDRVTVHYHGWLEDQTVFDSSDEPFSFRLGAGDVIPGWELGVVGMQVGEIRRLWIPAELAYGSEGVEGIPPDSNLFFDVELVALG